MAQNNILLVNREELKQIIHDAVFEAVNECLPSAIPDDRKYYTIKDIAQKWGVCEQTIWRYAKLGRIRSVKVGRLVRFEKEYIDHLDSLGELRTVGRTYITKAEKNLRNRKK